LVREFVELRLIDVRDLRDHVQMARRDRESVARLVDRHRSLRLDSIRRESGLAEYQRQRHRETPGVRGPDQLLGIRPGAGLEARLETVLRLFEHAGFGGDHPAALFETALPYGRCLL